MRVTVNGEPRDLPDGATTLRAVLDCLRYSFPLQIARVNGRLVERGSYESAPISEGDVLDLYHLVSGG
jgi:sulfur carrier protein